MCYSAKRNPCANECCSKVVFEIRTSTEKLNAWGGPLPSFCAKPRGKKFKRCPDVASLNDVQLVQNGDGWSVPKNGDIVTKRPGTKRPRDVSTWGRIIPGMDHPKDASSHFSQRRIVQGHNVRAPFKRMHFFKNNPKHIPGQQIITIIWSEGNLRKCRRKREELLHFKYNHQQKHIRVTWKGK
jgi:hypothetical protein